MKSKIGLAGVTVMALVISVISIRLSGHRHSMGVLFLSLLFIDIFALLVGVFFHAVKLLQFRQFLIFFAFVVASIVLFLLFHNSYDSSRETRRVFWGLNGE